MRGNEEVVELACKRCPACNSKRFFQIGNIAHQIIDLKYFRDGVKRWVTKFQSWNYRCGKCDSIFTHPEFPRSIRFSVESLDAALHRISGSPETNYANEAERLSGRLRYDLDFAAIADIFDYGLHEYLTLTQKRLAEISRALFEIYCATNETISPPSIAEGRTA